MYTSAFGTRLPLLSYRSYVLFCVHGGSEFSTQRSGIMNGFTHVTAFAGDASPVAVAEMLTLRMPNTGPTNVGTGFDRSAVLNTSTLTRLFAPVGLSGKVTSVVFTSTAPP